MLKNTHHTTSRTCTRARAHTIGNSFVQAHVAKTGKRRFDWGWLGFGFATTNMQRIDVIG